MSNFYRNTVDIVVGSTTSPSIIHYITQNLTCFTENGTDIFNIVPTYDPTYTSVFEGTIGVDEKPNRIGYSYQGTDISTWSIAPYIDGANGESFTQANLPSWCKNIRVITIGGGGSGTAAVHVNQNSNQDYYQHHNHVTPQTQNDDSSNQHHVEVSYEVQNQYDKPQPNSNHQNSGTTFNQNNNYDYHNHHQYNVNQASTGGGGGAGIYLTSISTQTYSQIQIQNQLSTSQVSKPTVLSLSNGTYTITAGGGINSTAGTVTTQGFQIQGSQISGPVSGYGYTGANGQSTTACQNGINNSQGAFTTTLIYGDGGEGKAGAAGYYRVYFLTN